MTREDILAVVVSYNGLAKTRETVRALGPQVGHVHIVDNGSDAASLEILDGLAEAAGVSVVRLGANRGIGHALNLGVARAREMGFDWLLTMDQDSMIDGRMIEAYQAAISRDPTLVCLSPHRSNAPERRARSGRVSYAITSGNLVRMSLFDEVGEYDEGFFIDCVDFDFSLRVRQANHAICLVPDATMHHQLGEALAMPTVVRRFYAQHAPVRRYYMFRNYLYLAERYLFGFPTFILKLGLLQVLLLPLIGILDRHPLESFRAVGLGVWHYLLRRNGPYVGRAA